MNMQMVFKKAVAVLFKQYATHTMAQSPVCHHT